MNNGWELAAVVVVVLAAGTWAVRALVRSLKKPGGCSSCAGSGACPLAKGPEAGGATGTCPSSQAEPGLHTPGVR